MIILDTSVISALLSEPFDPPVIRWLDNVPRIDVWTTSISDFEIRYGLAIMPEGKRKHALVRALELLVNDLLDGRIVSFDSRAANESAFFALRRKEIGRPVEMRDIMISGIALAHGARLATRNIRDFEHSGLDIVNPWETAL